MACHGDIVDNMDDGHYIPTYEPSLVTPLSRDGEGDPLNIYGNGAGACNYCHDTDNPDQDLAVIRDNHDLHHYAGRAGEGGLGARCAWCHDEDRARRSALARTVTDRTRCITSRPIPRQKGISEPSSWVVRTPDAAT